MKAILGVVMIVGGVVFGVWAGLWWAFVGGIIQIIHAVQASPVEGADIAWGIVKIIFAGAIGGVSAMALVLPGAALVNAD